MHDMSFHDESLMLEFEQNTFSVLNTHKNKLSIFLKVYKCKYLAK